MIEAGLLKRYILPLKHGFFNTKIKGNHHSQANVQVYNVRIPVEAGFPTLRQFLAMSEIPRVQHIRRGLMDFRDLHPRGSGICVFFCVYILCLCGAKPI